MKRILSLILALAMLVCAFALVACGDEPAETKPTETTETIETPGSTVPSEPTESTESTASTETSGSTETTASEPGESTESSSSGREVIPDDPTLDGRSKHPDYMDVNFGGKEFSFIVNDGWSGGWDVYEICAEITGDDTILDEAIELRNKTVETLYNCKITQQKSNYDSGIHPQSFVADDIALGQCRFQFAVSLFQNTVATNFCNLAAMDLNLGHSWWDQDYIDTFSLNLDGTEHLYSLSGHFNLLNYDSTIALLVNRDLYDQLLATGKIKEDIFQAVRENRWTMQMLYETMLEASTDVNGDLKLTFDGGDVFGMVDDGNCNIIKGLLASAGVDGLVKNELGLPIPLNTSDEAAVQHMFNAADMTSKIFTAPTFGLIKESECIKTMASGQALFMPQYVLRLHDVQNTGDCADGLDVSDAKLSILPFPMLDETQERYYSFVCNRATCLRVSRAIDNPTEVANFLEVFGFHSQKLLYPQYVNYLRTQCLDGKDGDMLDYVLENRHFDLGTFTLKGVVNTAVGKIYGGGKVTTSVITRSYSEHSKALNEYVENLKKTAQQ